MPYIPPDKRFTLSTMNNTSLENAGDLNYAIHLLVELYFNTHGMSYKTSNDVVGALECAKLEIYRRKIAEYEDKKIKDNGDIDFYKKC